MWLGHHVFKKQFALLIRIQLDGVVVVQIVTVDVTDGGEKPIFASELDLAISSNRFAEGALENGLLHLLVVTHKDVRLHRGVHGQDGPPGRSRGGVSEEILSERS